MLTKPRYIADLAPDNPIRISRAQIWASFTPKEIKDMSILAKSKNNDIRSMGEWLMVDYASWQATQIQPEVEQPANHEPIAPVNYSEQSGLF